jgi:hypothetical protein
MASLQKKEKIVLYFYNSGFTFSRIGPENPDYSKNKKSNINPYLGGDVRV